MTADIDLDAIRERAVLYRANQMQHEKTYDRATALTAAAFLCAQDVPALLSALTATGAKLEKVTAERDEADRLTEKLTLTIRAFPHADNAANIAHARAQRDDYQGRHVQAELLLAATERERDAASAEIERLKVERGEALLWSPWNDHDVLFEQWAKRRAGAGDGEQDPGECRPCAPCPVDGPHCACGERHQGDAVQDTATCGACGGSGRGHSEIDIPCPFCAPVGGQGTATTERAA